VKRRASAAPTITPVWVCANARRAPADSLMLVLRCQKLRPTASTLMKLLGFW